MGSQAVGSQGPERASEATGGQCLSIRSKTVGTRATLWQVCQYLRVDHGGDLLEAGGFRKVQVPPRGTSHSGSLATAQDPQAKLQVLRVMAIRVKPHPHAARDKCAGSVSPSDIRIPVGGGKKRRKQARPGGDLRGDLRARAQRAEESCASVCLVCQGRTEE